MFSIIRAGTTINKLSSFCRLSSSIYLKSIKSHLEGFLLIRIDPQPEITGLWQIIDNITYNEMEFKFTKHNKALAVLRESISDILEIRSATNHLSPISRKVYNRSSTSS